jgi:hypothetical protein
MFMSPPSSFIALSKRRFVSHNPKDNAPKCTYSNHLKADKSD